MFTFRKIFLVSPVKGKRVICARDTQRPLPYSGEGWCQTRTL